jgi:hypothetical protein
MGEAEMNAADAIGLAALCLAAASIFTGPIGRAIADRLRGRRASGAEVASAAEIEALRGRLVEVEERLDFAERLLTEGRQADQISRGADR